MKFGAALPRVLSGVFLVLLVFFGAGVLWRVGLSMRRGRRAVFSTRSGEFPLPQRLLVDIASLSPEAEAAPVLFHEGSPVARRSLSAGAGGVRQFPVRLPPGAALSFFSGGKGGGAGDSLWVEVVPSGGGAPQVLYRRSWGSARKEGGPSDLPWERVEADLSPWSDQAVVLRFGMTTVSASTAAAAYWGGPGVWVSDARPWPGRATGADRRASAAWERRPPENVLWTLFQTFPLPALNGLDLRSFPALSRLAGEGVEFQQVTANSLFVGEGLKTLLGSRSPAADPPPGAPTASSLKPVPSFPVVLRQAGYRSVLMGAPGDLAGWISYGFDEAHAPAAAGAGPEAVVRRAARWLTENGGRSPHAVFVYVRDPLPAEDPSPRCWFRSARLSPSVVFDFPRWKAWSQAVQGDGALERLWDQLDRLGLSDRTLTAVTSLRGRSFRREMVRRVKDGRRVFHRMRPGWGLREAETRALWLMRHPALSPGARVTDPAQLLDAAPTALSLLRRPGGSVEDSLPVKGWEGRSFAAAGLWSGAPDQAARFLLHGPGGEALLLDGHYKYIRRSPSSPLKGGIYKTAFEPEELYDLWSDPEEKRNLSRRNRHLLSRARRAMADHWPERKAMTFRFEGFGDPPLQGYVSCPGGELWNVSLSFGALQRNGSTQVTFLVEGPSTELTFEAWPPPASFIASLRSKGRSLPASSFVVSRLGLPLMESAGEDWYDINRFPWMEGVPEIASGSVDPRVYLGRTSVRRSPTPEGLP